jgi:hypothetical protein
MTFRYYSPAGIPGENAVSFEVKQKITISLTARTYTPRSLLQDDLASFLVIDVLEALVAHAEDLIARLQPAILPGRALRKYIQHEHPVL